MKSECRPIPTDDGGFETLGIAATKKSMYAHDVDRNLVGRYSLHSATNGIDKHIFDYSFSQGLTESLFICIWLRGLVNSDELIENDQEQRRIDLSVLRKLCEILSLGEHKPKTSLQDLHCEDCVHLVGSVRWSNHFERL